MRKQLFLSVLILSMALLLLSCKSVNKTQRIITPTVALVVEKEPASDNLGTNKKAVETYKQDIMIEHDDAGVHYNLGVSYDNVGMYKEAIEAYKQAIRIKPDCAEAHYNLGFSYLMLDDIGSTFEEYKILKNLDPQMADNLYKVAILKASSDKDNIYIVQVGAFNNPDLAKELVAKLKADYPYVYIERINNFDKVRILGIKTKEEGTLIIKEINKKFELKPFLLNAH